MFQNLFHFCFNFSDRGHPACYGSKKDCRQTDRRTNRQMDRQTDLSKVPKMRDRLRGVKFLAGATIRQICRLESHSKKIFAKQFFARNTKSKNLSTISVIHICYVLNSEYIFAARGRGFTFYDMMYEGRNTTGILGEGGWGSEKSSNLLDIIYSRPL